MRVWLIVVIVGFAISTGCVGGMSNVVKPEVVKKHGATHLRCEPDNISVSKIDDTTWKVEGCGASVVMTCWTSVGQGEGTCVKQ